MKRRYVTADVFTFTTFKGNPVAVVLDAQGLSTAQMQSIANEFAYSETTFVLPPRDPAHTAWVRIFTASREIPFAGHPNIGTAFVLARAAADRSAPLPEALCFEELAGLVPVRQLLQDGAVVGAELIAPEPLSLASAVAPARVAACLSLSSDAIRTEAHMPRVVSVGLPFLVVELRSREALSRCMPDRGAFRDLMPLDGAVSIYAYTRAVPPHGVESSTDLQSRMFTPHMTEDPATGSAAGALVAFLAHLDDLPRLSMTVGQGSDMGRQSTLFVTAETIGGKRAVRVGGHCVQVMEGTFDLPGGD
ncbi:PhzF family phenazine biosynthesis protein [Robbsia sp. Bb-Pol-6]|uniref:PhzF family phenazine biosynthesis protein n=1 Tax=Robbsia betulipollinis TaxID=2981849 RepID=A0ABT3ZJR4_9BURK|nr:PhzF family phenazine biosynthesis protein [Robbsia betulipollinis]MCY0386520.1 PhzF family phenazine biosynthesis protein [Robbsia betulipollinis]